MNQKGAVLTETQRSMAEVVADIIKGVPVTAQEFYSVIISTYKSGLQDGRKAERSLQQLTEGRRQNAPGA